MIARLSGKIIEKGADYLLVDVGGISYEVLLPQTAMQRLDENKGLDNHINLVTYHYHQIDHSRGIPVLIGFINEVERDFFQQFITVSGIGPRAALKALNKPISVISQAIDEGNIEFLKSLPGIGQQRAKDIIAKLQGRVGKFCLIQDASIAKEQVKKDIVEDALAVLMQLEYKQSEARTMIDKVLKEVPDIQSGEQLLNEIYKQRQKRE